MLPQIKNAKRAMPTSPSGISAAPGTSPNVDPLAGALAAEYAPPSYSGGGKYFSDGGAIDDGDSDDQDSQASPSMDDGLGDAMASVDAALAYGRDLHGLGGSNGMPGSGEEPKTAAAMPTIPGNQSESGLPRPRPGGPGTQKLSAAMPTIPGNPSESGIPRPRPGGPGTQKLAAAMPTIPGNQSETPGPYKPQPKLAEDDSGAIPDDDDQYGEG